MNLSSEIATICSWHLQMEQESARLIPADVNSAPKVENYSRYYVPKTRMCSIDLRQSD
jgi:hypothetical protein